MKQSTAHYAPFELAPQIVERLKKLRGDSPLAFVTIYHRESQTAIHASVRHDDTILSVAISSPTPENQARKEASSLSPYLPEGCGSVFEVINPPNAN